MTERPGRGRRLVLVRHGRTAWNAEGRAQGHADVSLDDMGRAQAEAMADMVADFEPVLLVTSDLARARETAAFLEKTTGLTAREDRRLREYDVGERTGLTAPEFAARMGTSPSSWDVHAHVDVPGAETSDDVAQRIVPALQQVLEDLQADETAVVVLHGAALRVGLAGTIGWPISTAATMESMRNCAWAVLAESGDGPLRLSAYNVTVGGTDPD
ncbi:MAG: histidine phosphatase family protein [Marmoricola sp.]